MHMQTRDGGLNLGSSGKNWPLPRSSYVRIVCSGIHTV